MTHSSGGVRWLGTAAGRAGRAAVTVCCLCMLCNSILFHQFWLQAMELVLERIAAIKGGSDPEPKMPLIAEYALLRLRSAYLEPQSSPVVARLPSAVDVFSGGADKLLGAISQRGTAMMHVCASSAASFLLTASQR